MRRQSGNALFLILIAVALFAALSYAITNSGRGSGSIERETLEIETAKIMQMFSMVDATVQRWTLANGWNINNIDFYTPDMTSGIGDTSGCTDDECNVFHSSGAGIDPYLPFELRSKPATGSCSTISTDPAPPGMFVISILGHGSDLSELIMYYNCVDLDLCERINIASGALESGDTPLIGMRGDWNTDFQYFRSAGILDGFTPNQLGKDDARINGQSTFCYKNAANSPYGELVHVVYAR